MKKEEGRNLKKEERKKKEESSINYRLPYHLLLHDVDTGEVGGNGLDEGEK